MQVLGALLAAAVLYPTQAGVRSVAEEVSLEILQRVIKHCSGGLRCANQSASVSCQLCNSNVWDHSACVQCAYACVPHSCWARPSETEARYHTAIPEHCTNPNPQKIPPCPPPEQVGFVVAFHDLVHLNPLSTDTTDKDDAEIAGVLDASLLALAHRSPTLQLAYTKDTNHWIAELFEALDLPKWGFDEWWKGQVRNGFAVLI